VLVDPEASEGQLVLTESAAILIYLAEKTGKLLPASGAARARVFEQLFFHASSLGPGRARPGTSSGRPPSRSRSQLNASRPRLTAHSAS
jgi:glutathione S-transferase